jgi:hypothetical protein
MPSHEERALELVEFQDSLRALSEPVVTELQEAIAQALRAVELEAYERAAKVADEMHGTVPLSRENVCDTIAQAIRDLAVKEGEG